MPSYQTLPALTLLLLLQASLPCLAEDTSLLDLDFEALMDIEITSLAKRSQSLSEAAGAVFVISNKDLQQSGVTSIPEALRMVPGLQVARIDSSKWAVTSRGLNGRFATKLLVLIDGRSAYSPLFSGVFWDIQDTLLEDIERIEVIRGPGATLWGANAVNGVINIITKKAKDTQGGLLKLAAGDVLSSLSAFRYGGQLDENNHFRVFGQHRAYQHGQTFSGEAHEDDWYSSRGGFRFDRELPHGGEYTLQGDLYTGTSGQLVQIPILTTPFVQRVKENSTFSGGNLLTRYHQSVGEEAEINLQAYYDRTERKSTGLRQKRDTLDIEFQHLFALTTQQTLVWGLGFRYLQDTSQGDLSIRLEPKSRSTRVFNAFVQDDLTFWQEQLRFSIGTKLEHNDYSGFEWQPSLRVSWSPASDYTLWGAISRAVRTPSRIEHDGRIDSQAFPGPTLIALFGDDNLTSEVLIAYELGYRHSLSTTLSLDLALFFNDYDRLRTLEPGQPFIETSPSPPHGVVPLAANNLMAGEVYGAELAVDWQLSPHWHSALALTLMEVQLHRDRNSQDAIAETNEGDSPHHQLSLRLSYTPSQRWEASLWGRYVGSLANQEVGRYFGLDARLAWHPVENVELSLLGQNLLDPRHPEFAPELLDLVPSEVERAFYARVLWHF